MKHNNETQNIGSPVSIMAMGEKPLSERAISKSALFKKAKCVFAASAMIAAFGAIPNPANAEAFPNISARTIERGGALDSEDVMPGVILATRSITVKSEEPSELEETLGEVVGGFLGYKLSENSSSDAARFISAYGGVRLGRAAADALNGMQGESAQQVFIRVTDDDGDTKVLTSVQDNDQPGVVPGASVLVVEGQNGYRIIPVDRNVVNRTRRINNDDYQSRNANHRRRSF